MRKIKKFTAILLTLVMVIGVVATTSITVGAAGNTISNATYYSLGNTVYGSITDTNKQDFYKFTLSTSGRIALKLNAYIYCTHYYIYDSNGDEVWKNTYQYWNSTSEKLAMNENIDLTSGTYYFCVSQSSGTGNYDFKADFKSANESFKETTGGTNNNIKTPSSISLNTTYYGQIAVNDDKDFYKFTLPTSGRVSLSLNAYIYCTHYYIYDSDGDEVWKNTYQYWNSTSEKLAMNENIDLTSGTYYFCVSQSSGTGNYDFKADFKSANESFKETTRGTNNNIKTPSSISLNTTYYGQIAVNDSKDFYKFTLSSSEKISLNLNAYIYCTHYYIYDSNGDEVWKKSYQYWNSTSEKLTLNESIELKSGTYYFCISQSSGTGNYNFSINSSSPISPTSVSLNATSLSLDVGSTYTLKATVSPSNATNKTVTWSSSNTSVATVSSNGYVTAKKAGTATITVKTSNGKTASCTVKVIPSTVNPTSVSLNTASLSLEVGSTYTLKATVSPSNATNKTVTWSSSNTSIATVSSSGYVTAKAAGTATITAKASNGKTASCTVKVIPKPVTNTPQIVVDSKSASQGSKVTVNVSLKNNPGIVGMALKLSYDSNVLTLEKAESVGIDAVFSQNLTTNPFLISWQGGTSPLTANGTVVKLTFAVKSNAKNGTYPIKVTYEDDDIYDVNFKNVRFEPVDGSVKVLSYLPGDINQDGKVNLKDVTRLHQYVAGWKVTVNAAAIDVNGDGKVNLKDVTRLHQYVAGWKVAIY